MYLYHGNKEYYINRSVKDTPIITATREYLGLDFTKPDRQLPHIKFRPKAYVEAKFKDGKLVHTGKKVVLEPYIIVPPEMNLYSDSVQKTIVYVYNNLYLKSTGSSAGARMKE